MTIESGVVALLQGLAIMFALGGPIALIIIALAIGRRISG